MAKFTCFYLNKHDLNNKMLKYYHVSNMNYDLNRKNQFIMFKYSTMDMFYSDLCKSQVTAYIFLQLLTASYILNKNLTSSYIFLHLFTSPYIFLHLLTSPYISLHHFFFHKFFLLNFCCCKYYLKKSNIFCQKNFEISMLLDFYFCLLYTSPSPRDQA